MPTSVYYCNSPPLLSLISFNKNILSRMCLTLSTLSEELSLPHTNFTDQLPCKNQFPSPQGLDTTI